MRLASITPGFLACLGGAGSLALAPVASVPVQAGAPPTLAQVRRAFSAVHPASIFACPEGIPFVTLANSHPVFACLDGDNELTLQNGHRTTTLELAPHAGSYLNFSVTGAGQLTGSYLVESQNQEEVTSFTLVLSGARGMGMMGKPGEARFVTLSDSAMFTVMARRVLAGKEAPPVGTLNDTGYLLQQAGYPHAALRLLTAVVQRAPSRAVAYLNRGDTYWQLSQLAAAQADYRRYIVLLRTQHKDTTRVPAYVRLALRLPAR